MVDFGKLLKESEEQEARDKERGYSEEKKTLMRCPICQTDQVYDGYVEAHRCWKPHRPRQMMRIIKTYIEQTPVGKDVE